MINDISIWRKLVVYDTTNLIHPDINDLIIFFKNEIASLTFDNQYFFSVDGYPYAMYTSDDAKLQVSLALEKKLAKALPLIYLNDQLYMYKYAFEKYHNINCQLCSYNGVAVLSRE